MTETNIKNAKENQNKKSRPCFFKKFLNLKFFNYALFILIASAGIFYLVGINDLTVKGFRLQELRGEIFILSNDMKGMEGQVMSLKSYNDLSAKARELGMVALGEVEYLTVMDGVAVK